MSKTNETFTERVDVSTQPDGEFIGTLEMYSLGGRPWLGRGDGD